MPEKYPIIMQPALKSYPWGGNALCKHYNKSCEIYPLAESWELSCHRDGKSRVDNGVYSGYTLEEYINLDKTNIVGNKYSSEDFPLLIKLIDAHEPLSVQVHPHEKYAQENEGDHGKAELWYVLSCRPNSSLVYGFNRSVTRADIARRIQANTLNEVLNRVCVRPGDSFFVKPGTIHAIGEGIVVAEIQQNSNATYRIWDYGRLGNNGKPRDLHIQKAMDVLDTEPVEAHVKGRQTIYHGSWEETLIGQCSYFRVTRLITAGSANIPCCPDSFTSLLCLSGACEIDALGSKTPVKPGQTVFLPAGLPSYVIRGNATLLSIE